MRGKINALYSIRDVSQVSSKLSPKLATLSKHPTRFGISRAFSEAFVNWIDPDRPVRKRDFAILKLYYIFQYCEPGVRAKVGVSPPLNHTMEFRRYAMGHGVVDEQPDSQYTCPINIIFSARACA